VVNALKPSQSKLDGEIPPLRVVNGMPVSTATSSALTTAAQENFPISRNSPVDGLPGRIGNSTIRWGGGLNTHPEAPEHEGDALSEDMHNPVAPPARRPITPSLATLEKAVSARIYFENLYFPLLRQAPSREQRRLAMERDMMEMQLNEKQKDNLRGRWRRNETEYLRDRRRKVDASAFIKLKTIGHGVFNM
jgi:protein-serine/threonine kinase